MIGTGWVASAGALIYAAAEKKQRFCLPNTRFLLHQPMGGVQGPATDIDIEAREIIKMRERLSQIIATETGQSIERVRKDTERNYWMSASEAIDYGLAYKIISSIEELRYQRSIGYQYESAIWISSVSSEKIRLRSPTAGCVARHADA